jgi:alkylation response protein AidB-like acyl-CoA dehydrogenase
MKRKITLASPNISQQRTNNILEWLRDYSTKRMNSRLMDERRCVPPYIMMDLGNHGILGMQIEETYGGLALNYQDCIRVLEQIAAIDLSLATIVFLNNSNGIRPIQYYSNNSIRDEFLPKLATGRQLASFGLTEPIAGANIAGIQAQAIPQGEGKWKIRGMKRWNASGWTGVMSVFVRLMGENNKLGGISGFVVPQDSEGVIIGPEVLTMGVRSIVQNSIYFDNVNVTENQILGELGKGIEIIDDTFLVGRLYTATVGLGAMKRCTQLMLRYASRREVSTGLLLNSPLTLSYLSELTVKITVLDSLLKISANILDQEKKLPFEVAMAVKIFSSEECVKAANNLIQLLGGRGYMEQNIAPQILRDAKLLTVGEGPNESLNLYIGRSATYTNNIYQFLSEIWGQETIAKELKQAVEEIKDYYLQDQANFQDKSASMTYTYFMVGNVTITAILYAAINYANQLKPSLELSRALQWTQLNFADSITNALNQSKQQSMWLTSNQVTEMINSYQNSIADLEQTLAGVEENLDPLLSKNPNNLTTSYLPGDINPNNIISSNKVNNLSKEEKRQLLAKLLQK